MGMFSRMSDIVQANINAMLDKAEDPQKVIRLIVQEMEETLVELRSVAARHLADKKQLERQISKLEQQVADWHTKAELAINKGRDDLARAALAEKHQAQQKCEAMQKDFTVIDENLSKLQEDTGRLNSKLAEARAKQKTLAIREQSVSARLKMKNEQQVVRIDEAIGKFEQYQRRIDDLEAQVDAYDLTAPANSLNAQFAELENNSKLEDELAALKRKVA